MKNIDLKDKKVKGALVIVGASLALIFLYFNLFGLPSTDEGRNDKKIENGENASYLNFNVPSIKDSVRDETLSFTYEKQRKDSIDNAKKNAEILSYGVTPNTSNSYQSSKESFSDRDFENMRKNAIKNSHSTYGTNDMWSSKPSVDVGYSDMGNVIESSSHKKLKTSLIKTEVKYDIPTDQENQTFSSAKLPQEVINSNSSKEKTKEEKLQESIAKKYGSIGSTSQNISVKAQIFGDQKVGGGNNNVRIILQDRLNLGNTTIGTDANIYGIASLNGSNINISITNISYKGKTYPVNLKVYDYRTGQMGIPVNLDNIIGTITDRSEQVASSEVSRYGRVGQVLNSIFSGRNKSQKIELNSGHQIYLKSDN